MRSRGLHRLWQGVRNQMLRWLPLTRMDYLGICFGSSDVFTTFLLTYSFQDFATARGGAGIKLQSGHIEEV